MGNILAETDLREIAARASTHDERLAGGFIADDTPAAAQASAAHLQAWCKTAAAGDDTLFQKRLARDGLRLDAVKPLLGSVRFADDARLPSWVGTLRWTSAAMAAEHTIISRDSLFDRGHPEPFEDLFLSLVSAAWEKIENKVADKANTLGGMTPVKLQRSLLHRLTGLCAEGLLEGFTIFKTLQQPVMQLALPSGDLDSRGAYNDYIQEMRSSGLRTFLMDRPVLARLLAVVVQQWIDASSELLCRLDSDREVLQQALNHGEELGSLVDLDLDLSDPHNSGRTVGRLVFASGLHVAYKPRSVGLDLAWLKLLQWLEQHGAPFVPRAPQVIERGVYGRAEWIPFAPCTSKSEVKAFYQRAGSLLCLVHILQGTDVNLENLVAQGPHSVLVDHETLMHPWFTRPFPIDDPRAAISAAAERLGQSVLATGFLPSWMIVPGARLAGIGGLNAAELSKLKRWTIQGTNKDGMRLDYVSVNTQAGKNLPVLDGDPRPPAGFSEDLCAGFEAMYCFIRLHQNVLGDAAGPLTAFAKESVRVILRPTQFYWLLSWQSRRPSNLRDGVAWSLQHELLARLSNWDDDHDPFWSSQKHERKCLANLDIPYFTARVDD